MSDVLVVAVAGFAAAFVDGALGMGFGPTSSSILLSSGLSPAAVSATVNIAKVASGAAGGAAHWRFGNIDRRLVARLAIPGVLGALVGTTILTNVDGDQLRPILAVLLLVIGLRILVRFRAGAEVGTGRGADGDAPNLRGTEVAGAAGGVTNGLIGAWGPVVTPFLLHRGVLPRFVVGSVNTAEIAVATVAAGSLLTAERGLEASTVIAMLVGGVLAAPVAAMTVRRIPARALGVLVAGLLLLTNTRELAIWGELGDVRWLAYATVLVTVLAVGRPTWRTAPAPTSAAVTSVGNRES